MHKYHGFERLAPRVLGLVLVSVLTLSGAASFAAPRQQEGTPTATTAGGQATPALGTPFQVAQVATPGGTLPSSPEIALVQVAEGLIDPVNVVPAPDGSGRLYVIERPGRIVIVEEGQVMEEPFLDISDQVLSAFLEQGLYDMAFHPEFASNGLVYVHYAELLRNGDSLIVEYETTGGGTAVDPDSARVLMQIDQPWANHNGGEIEFGPDGYLYIGSGDGGWEGDPLEAGQDLSTLLGKLLRIDVNPSGGRPYSIPDDNPFASNIQPVQLFGVTEEEFAQIHTEARPEIWAYGLRNPWKFQFDPETGDLYLPDVGQNHLEEINFQPADSEGGENYGWDFLMGTNCFPINQEECAAVGVLPVAEYTHDLGSAIIGIGIYRGNEFAALDGVYFAGDYGSGRIWGLAQDDGGDWAFEELLDTELLLTGAGQDAQGNLYVTSCQCTYGGGDPQDNPPGALWMIVAADSVAEGTATAPVQGGGDATGTPAGGTAAPGATGSPEATGSPAAGAATATPAP